MKNVQNLNVVKVQLKPISEENQAKKGTFYLLNEPIIDTVSFDSSKKTSKLMKFLLGALTGVGISLGLMSFLKGKKLSAIKKTIKNLLLKKETLKPTLIKDFSSTLKATIDKAKPKQVKISDFFKDKATKELSAKIEAGRRKIKAEEIKKAIKKANEQFMKEHRLGRTIKSAQASAKAMQKAWEKAEKIK